MTMGNTTRQSFWKTSFVAIASELVLLVKTVGLG